MTREETINTINNVKQNSKTNNLVIATDDNSILSEINETSDISFEDNLINVNKAVNIKIDLEKVRVEDILNYSIDYLKKQKYIDSSFVYDLPFCDRFDLLKFNIILRDYNIVVQFIFYNADNLSKDYNMLFNELYYFNSVRLNVITIIKNHLNTYFLANGDVLDNRENYERIEIKNPKTLKL